jgi:hypothetical protein
VDARRDMPDMIAQGRSYEPSSFRHPPYVLWRRRQTEGTMAGKKGRFTVNSTRFDPYKNFKFRVAIGSVIAAIAGLGLLRALRGAEPEANLDPKDYLPPEPTPPPPIPGTATNTSARARTRRRASARKRTPTGRRGRP